MVKKIILFVFLVLSFTSCKTISRVEYCDRVDTLRIVELTHDTTIIERHDSVYHEVIQNGDTVYDTKYVERTKYKDRIVTKIDTCWRTKIDTQITEKVVEKRYIPKWCYFCLGIIIFMVIFAIIKLVLWLRTKHII